MSSDKCIIISPQPLLRNLSDREESAVEAAAAYLFAVPGHWKVTARGQCRVAQQKNLEGYVGFANLPNQVYRKSVKRGFEFTLMVVGKI